MKNLLFTLAFVALATAAFAQGKLDYEANDTVRTVLQRQAGQRVELRLQSGEKLAGKVEKLGTSTVHLSAIAGMELFDAVVVLDDVSAVVVRAK